MTNAEQWLADLEAKAKAYKSSSTYERLIAKDEYFAAANPAAVLRLVGMVRWLAAQRQELLSGYCPEDMRVGCLGNCIDCRHGQIAIKSAYAATETRHAHD